MSDAQHLVHSVFFTLHDNSPAAVERLVAACRRFLTGHPGTLFFAAGPRGPEFQRPVNDQEFDVALVVVFQTKAAHDDYQLHPRHREFIDHSKDNWKTVRVFDSYSG